MIRSFKHRGLKRAYERDDWSRIDPKDHERLAVILQYLDVAQRIEDLGIHGWRLHPLSGKRQGEWSITVRSNWRITFRFENGEVLDVDLVDYH